MVDQWSMKSPLWTRALKRGVIAGAVMALVSLFMPDHFKSKVVLLPDRSLGAKGNQLLGSISGLSSLLGSAGALDGADANYPDILTSRWVCEQLLRKEFTFRVRSWRYGGWKERKQTLMDYLDEDDIDRALEALLKRYSAEKTHKSYVTVFTVETTSPELSRDIAASAIQLLDRFIETQLQTRGAAKAKFVSERLAEAKREYSEAERVLRAFQYRNRNFPVSTDPGVRLEGERLSALFRFRESQVAALMLHHEQALMDAKDDTPMVNILDQANLPIRKTRPARSLLVLLAFSLAAAASLILDNRKTILEVLRQREI